MGFRADSVKSKRRGCGASCLPTCVLLIRGCASSSKLHRIGTERKRFPIDPETGQHASYKDPAAWGTLEEAIAGCARFDADGVGYAFMYYDNIVGLDLDNCRNPATGEIDQWASEIIREANSYSEVTPSGTGVRIFIDGRWRHPEHKTDGLGSAGKGSLEIYSEWFFAITGDHLDGTPREIERRSDVVERLHTRFFALSKTIRRTHHSDGSGGH